MRKLSRFIFLAFALLFIRYAFSVLVGYLLPTYIVEQDKVLLNESAFITGKKPNFRLSEIWGKGQSVYFSDIAINGYELGSDAPNLSIRSSLFPLYPTLIRVAYKILPISTNIELVYWIGAVLSTLFLGSALFYLDKLMDLVWFHDEKKYMVYLLLLAFPGAFFFNLVYSESLFLLLTVLLLYHLYRKNYILASALLGLAAVTRAAGLILFIPFFLHVFLAERYNKKFNLVSNNLLYLSLALAPLLVFFYHLFEKTGSFLSAFKSYQHTLDFLFLPLGYFFDLFSQGSQQVLMTHSLNALILLGALGLMVFSFVKIYLIFEGRSLEQTSLFIYGLVYVLILSALGGNAMMFRYINVCLPAFMLPALFYNQSIRNSYLMGILFTFLILQSMFFTLFITGIPVYGH